MENLLGPTWNLLRSGRNHASRKFTQRIRLLTHISQVHNSRNIVGMYVALYMFGSLADSKKTFVRQSFHWI